MTYFPAPDPVLDYIRTKPFGATDRAALTCHKDNAHAIALYKSLGFAETGTVYDNEIEMAATVK